MQYDFDIFFNSNELQQFDRSPAQQRQNAPGNNNANGPSPRHKQLPDSISSNSTPSPLAAQSSNAQNAHQPAERRARDIAAMSSAQNQGRPYNTTLPQLSSAFDASPDESRESDFASLMSSENAAQNMPAQMMPSQMAVMTAEQSAMMMGHHNAFSNYMARIPSVSYGIRAPFRRSMPGASSAAAPFSMAGMSAFQQQPMLSATETSMMNMSQGHVSGIAGPSSAWNASTRGGGYGLSQFDATSMLGVGSQVLGSLPGGASAFSAFESSGAFSEEPPTSYGPTGLSSRSDESSGSLYQSAAAAQKSSGEFTHRPLSQPLAKKKVSPRAAVSPAQSQSSPAATKKVSALAVGTLNPHVRSRGARAQGSSTGRLRASENRSAKRAPTTNATQDDDEGQDDEEENDDENNDNDSSDLVYYLRPREVSKSHERLFRALSSSRDARDKQALKDGLVRARRMGPVVWQNLLRDPMNPHARPQRSTAPGCYSEDDDRDSDPDTWDDLPMKRRVYNKAMATQIRSGQPARASQDGGNADKFAESEAYQDGDVKGTPSSRESMQMDGTSPTFFIDFTPEYDVPTPQPTMSGPKRSTFKSSNRGLQMLTGMWSLDDAPLIDSPRNSRGQSIFADEC